MTAIEMNVLHHRPVVEHIRTPQDDATSVASRDSVSSS